MDTFPFPFEPYVFKGLVQLRLVMLVVEGGPIILLSKYLLVKEGIMDCTDL